MDVAHRCRAYPTEEVAAEAWRHIDIHRQIRNHAVRDYYNAPHSEKPSAYTQHNRLTQWKQRWPLFQDVSAHAAQQTITQIHRDLTGLRELRAKGYKTGRLKWQGKGEFRSVAYQSEGFNVDYNTGSRYATLHLSKIGDVRVRAHQPLPSTEEITRIVLKKETTGEWYVSIITSLDEEALPEKLPVEELDASNSVGVDLGILNYIHTSDGLSVECLDLEEEYDRLARAQRALDRKEKGSHNYETQRREVAAVKRGIRRKALDFQHKLTTWLVREYDAVFVEDLNVRGMLQEEGNARNKQDAAWRQFITLLEYKAELYGTHVKEVPAGGTTKECAACGVETAKPLWVREHSCPACGFETDRDANASLNVLKRGFEELGLGWPEGKPVETVTAVDADDIHEASASHVVEAGTPLP